MSTPIQEFLVSLGFKVDEASLRKFDEGVTLSRKGVLALGASAAGAALGVAYAVEKISKQYEDLYYASQRTGASVQGLQAIGFAAQQIGLRAEQGRGAIESFTAALRTNPGIEGLLQRWKVGPGEPQERLLDFIGKLKEFYGPEGYYAAAAQASVAGIDEATFKRMWDNLATAKSELNEYADRVKAAGLNTRALADDSVELQRALNRLWTDLSIGRDKIYGGLIEPSKEAVTWLDKLAQAATRKDGPIDYAIGLFSDVDAWSTSVNPRGGVFPDVNAAAEVTKKSESSESTYDCLMRNLWAFGDMLFDQNSWDGVRRVDDWTKTRQLEAGTGTAAQVRESGSAIFDALRMMGESGAGIQIASNAIGLGAGAAKGAALREQIVAFFEQQGWTRAQAFGIAANLQTEAPSFNPREVGDGGQAYGIAQWHPDRQRNFSAWSGRDIRLSTLEEQLAFIQHELTHGAEQSAGSMLRGAGTARDAAAVFSRYYERPRATFPEMDSRGALAQRWFDASPAAPGGSVSRDTNITQTNNITIHGAGSPQDTAYFVNSVLELDKVRWRLITRGDVSR